jgi:phage shock protein A
LEKKKNLEVIGATHQQAYAIARDNSIKMREMLNKLERDISQVNGKIALVKAMKGLTESQNKVTQMASTIGSSDSASSTLDGIMERAQFDLDKAMKRAELDVAPMDKATSVIEKYRRMGVDASVFDELSRLKEEVRGSSTT